MGKPGGGRNEIDRRFLSKFTVFNLTFPNDGTLEYIYSSILSGHLTIFDEDITKLSSILIKITIDLFKIIVTEVPATPSKFHYIFNLRDLSRICSGLLLTNPTIFQTKRQFLRVWRNEFTRVICDRLINNQDLILINGYITRMLEKHFIEESVYVKEEPILFGDYKNFLSDEIRFYEDLVDYETIGGIFKEILIEFNEREKDKLDIVLFDDALEHLTRIHRAIRLPRGHVLLIGVGGSGKNSLAKLAAFTAGYSVFEVTISRGYNEISFKDDLKKLFFRCGCENVKTVFLFSDAKLVHDGFLEFINNILTIGMVPALYTDDEKDTVINQCRTSAKESGYDQTK